MRRADRLFQIVNVLRRRRTATTAAHLGERLGVSERTVYRDVRDLVLAGTPIDGEAGVGYRICPGYDLPPLMFDRDEIQALVLGARIVRQFGDPALARASDAILAKVAAIVPKDLAPLVADRRRRSTLTIWNSRSARRIAGLSHQAGCASTRPMACPSGSSKIPSVTPGITVRGMTTRPPRRSTWASDAVMSGVST